MFFWLFILITRSWGPIFHQVVASQFADEYLSHLTNDQKLAFIHGSVFIDGLPKKKYHNLSNLIPLLKNYNSNTSVEYWYIMGFILHMTADSVGHIGPPLSYLPPKSPLHHFAELTVCSTILRAYNPPKLIHYKISENVYQKVVGKSSKLFSILYKAWRFIASFPFYLYLSSIENDSCKNICTSKYAMCNLELHMEAIKGLMFDSLLLINEGKFTNEILGKIVIKELSRKQCCV
ncbi:hypothetical protein TRFO_23760 [Tritrichomonas foetus]|uniref:Phospholipase C/D domain-containing protein n=1 Tax=Tritrichomonas foetus TaxID=1144522 RepID=A0A1J4KA96_9EUKA|nr:hypothetical protein TRFO_23760 [Tritrichomonas foetus]|eukprot:OHT07890.1 hypothetical protein TRFO_23760 [Tritrichomonas foetus]